MDALCHYGLYEIKNFFDKGVGGGGAIPTPSKKAFNNGQSIVMKFYIDNVCKHHSIMCYMRLENNSTKWVIGGQTPLQK